MNAALPHAAAPAVHEASCETLRPGDVHVWWARLDDLADLDHVLDDAELMRRTRFRRDQDRDLYGLAHGLLRHALSRHGGIAPRDWRFVEGSHGKPALAPDLAAKTGLTFSLSHSGRSAAVTIGRLVRVGIDIEPVDRAIDPDEIGRIVLAPSEIAALRHLDGAAKRRAFLTLWTLKEAYVKGLGFGLSYPLTACAFTVDGPSGAVVAQLPQDQASWHFEHRLIEGRDALSLAVETSETASPCILFRGRWI